MPAQKTLKRVKKDQVLGKSASTQAGEFVREEMEHIRKGKHGAKNTKQAIAIGLSKARRAGIPLKPPAKGSVSEKTRKSAKSASEKGKSHAPISRKRSVARSKALKKEPHKAASPSSLSKHALDSAKKRTSAERSKAAKKGVATKGHIKRLQSSKKAAAPKGKIKRSQVSKKNIAPKRQIKRLQSSKKAVAPKRQIKKPLQVSKKTVAPKGQIKRLQSVKKAVVTKGKIKKRSPVSKKTIAPKRQIKHLQGFKKVSKPRVQKAA